MTQPTGNPADPQQPDAAGLSAVGGSARGASDAGAAAQPEQERDMAHLQGTIDKAKAAGYAAGPAADVVLPTITATVTPTANDAGWHRTDPTVFFTCTDEESGLADGACPPAQTITDEGVHVVSGTVADRAGNEASASVTVRLDRTAPLVTLSGIPAAPTCTTTNGPYWRGAGRPRRSAKNVAEACLFVACLFA